MVGLLGRGKALYGREATRSLLATWCAAITERRAGDGRRRTCCTGYPSATRRKDTIKETQQRSADRKQSCLLHL